MLIIGYMKTTKYRIQKMKMKEKLQRTKKAKLKKYTKTEAFGVMRQYALLGFQDAFLDFDDKAKATKLMNALLKDGFKCYFSTGGGSIWLEVSWL